MKLHLTLYCQHILFFDPYSYCINEYGSKTWRVRDVLHLIFLIFVFCPLPEIQTSRKRLTLSTGHEGRGEGSRISSGRPTRRCTRSFSTWTPSQSLKTTTELIGESTRETNTIKSTEWKKTVLEIFIAWLLNVGIEEAKGFKENTLYLDTTYVFCKVKPFRILMLVFQNAEWIALILWAGKQGPIFTGNSHNYARILCELDHFYCTDREEIIIFFLYIRYAILSNPGH